ncbi:MAG: hypothetical protein AAF563_21400 [Pseudomonadota bacterium]
MMLSADASAANLEINMAIAERNGAPSTQLLADIFESHVTAALDDSSAPARWHRITVTATDEPSSVFDLVAAGEAQVALVSLTRHPWSLFPLSVSYMTPFSCDDPAIVGPTIDAMNGAFDALDLAWASLGLVYLGGGYAEGSYLLATSSPVETLEDLDGKVISAPELAVEWLQGTGATALAGDDRTFDVGLATGKIDGVITYAAEMERLSLDSYAPYLTDAGLGAVYEGGLVANRAWFERQRPSVQIALQEAAEAYGIAVADAQAAHGQAAIDLMVNRGARLHRLYDSERQYWADLLPDLAGNWAFELDVRNMPGTAMLADYTHRVEARCGEPLRAWNTPAP